MAPPAEHLRRITTADGIELEARLASPPDPRGVLLLCHGLTTDASEHGSFVALRNRALRARLAVVRADFRAHGHSDGTNEQLRLTGLRADVDAVIELIERALPAGLPLIPLGVSFGGAPATHAAATANDAAGLILWYAVVDYKWNFGPDSPCEATRLFRAAANPERDPPWAAMPVVNTEYYFPKALLEEFETDQTLDQLLGLDVPVLGYYGGRDKFVDPGPLRKLASEKPNIDLRVAWGAGHGFLLWRPWVIARTVAWAVGAVGAMR